MPEVEDFIERAGGFGTTEQVRVVGAQRRIVLSPHGGAVESSTDPVWVGSIGVIRNSSSPWWTTRLIEQISDEDAHELAPEAGSGTLLMSLRDADGAVWGVTSVPARSARRRWNLDFGVNVTAAFGTELAGRLLERALEFAWQQVEPGWLRPDSADAVAAARPVPDDAEWDNTDDSPRWLSMSALSYRGGGVMRRRSRRLGSD